MSAMRNYHAKRACISSARSIVSVHKMLTQTTTFVTMTVAAAKAKCCLMKNDHVMPI